MARFEICELCRNEWSCSFISIIFFLKFMKSRQIFGIHFFSVLLQLEWLYAIGTPFLNSQCSNRSAALLDLTFI